MTDNELYVAAWRMILVGALSLGVLAFGSCAYLDHEERVKVVESERLKAVEARAEADRAMFEAMKRSEAKP